MDETGKDQAIELEEQSRKQEIEYFLSKMHYAPEQLQSYRLLQGGISGAATYWLHMTNEELVCKITRVDSERSVLERAQRELHFYQLLAPQLPLRVPQVLASVQDAQGIVLLLMAYRPSPPARLWLQEQYVEVASQLGRLHAPFWKKTERAAQYSWLRRHTGNISVQRMQWAKEQWQALQEDARLMSLIPRHYYQPVMRLLSQLHQVESLLTSFPVTVCHGDCHSDNVLRDERENLIWADWQEVGIGLGPADVSFFIQRAFFAGGMVPDEAMIAAYHRQLEEYIEERLPLALLQRVTDAIEVRAWLLDWPPYLGQASAEHLIKLLERIDLLSKRLHLNE